jgi:hypothetical protein
MWSQVPASRIKEDFGEPAISLLESFSRPAWRPAFWETPFAEVHNHL